MTKIIIINIFFYIEILLGYKKCNAHTVWPKLTFLKGGLYVSGPQKSFLVKLIPFLTFTFLIFGLIRYSKNFMFTVLSFGQVTNIFGLLYSVVLQGRIRSSYKVEFSHLFSVNLTVLVVREEVKK